MFQEGNSKGSSVLRTGREEQVQDSQNPATEKQKKSSESPNNNLQVPQISLPKGGGALKGIDEKFEVNASNGLASFSVPVPLSSARNGFIPTLALSYNSGGGNSIFGLGWSCEVPAIQRRTDKKLPLYQDEEDIFIFSGVEDLVPALAFSGGEWKSIITVSGGHSIKTYRPRTEGSFSRIEKIIHPAKGAYWKVTTNNNVTTIFGRNETARIADPNDPKKIFKWLPEFSFDNMGNWIMYEYKAEDTDNVVQTVHEKNRLNAPTQPFVNRYLKRIRYGNRIPYYLDSAEVYDPQFPPAENYLFELVFDFGEHHADTPAPAEDPGLKWTRREDPYSDYRAGFEIRTYRLCRRMLMFHRFEELGETPCLVRSVDFTYAGSSVNNSGQHEVTYLKYIYQAGYIRKADNTYSKKTLPPLEMEYQSLQWDKTVRNVSPENFVHAPAGINNNHQWVDLYNEGIAGILTEQGDAWYYKSNWGDVDGDKDVSFSLAKPVIPKPSFFGLAAGTLSLQDLDGNGNKQVVVNSEGLQGYFELSGEDQWNTFKSFEQRANIRLNDPNIRMFDLDGDGLPDIVMSEDNVFTWFPSLGTKGYDKALKTAKSFDEEQGPAMVFADPLQTIFVADFNGDALPDIVRIRNAEVCYWPNLGYGKFGAKITMSNAPVFDQPDMFNPAYLVLADVSGTGATDIIYLAKNKFKAYLNLSGNALSDAHEINPFCRISKPNQVVAVDLLGTGTACILWSSDLPPDSVSPMRYIDLMSSKKPHLLVNYKNNLGKETSVEYKSSTYFFLKDKMEGNPWITKLPFPVQVVHKTSVEEKISNTKFTIEYRYHHGYYDHAEQEFRGFGMIEQLDTQNFVEWNKNNAGNLLEKSEALFQAPVLSKTWFHTGAFLDREKILTQYESGYWYNVLEKNGFTTSFTEPVLPEGKITIADPVAPNYQLSELTIDEYREALRACKGMMIRQEVFSPDTPVINPSNDEIKRGLTPYAVATHNCRIQLHQPKAQNKYAVFTVAESEALTLHYERDANDPRITHTLNIAIDDLGLVVEKAAIVYPRVQPDITLPQAVQNAQGKTFITCIKNSYTNDIILPELYRLRQASGVKTYELSKINKPGLLYSLADFDDVLGAATTEIPYEQTPGNTASRRLIEDVRTTYFNDALTAELPFGTQGNSGLKYQQYQLAFTPGIIQNIFGNKIDPADANPANRPDALMPQGNFVHFLGDSNWWIPSGMILNIKAGETIDDAKARFYAPVLYTDPAGATTTVTYYQNYFLLISAIEDGLNNITKVEAFNFYTLQPALIRDHNDNLSQVLYDELGLLKAVAFIGKDLNQDNAPEIQLADDLVGLTDSTSSSETTTIQNFFQTEDSVPLAVLGRTLLQHATVRYVYDYDKYLANGSPIAIATITRAVHHADEPPGNPGQLFIEFEYTNGTGQVVMMKVQAEPGMAKKVTVNNDNTFSVTTIDTSAQVPERLRWIGNGRIVLNNKGKPVKQFEPYFSATPFYESQPELVETGVTPVIHYDPLGRITRTDLPEGTFTSLEFTSWYRKVFDVNDNTLTCIWYNDRFNNLIDAELLAEGKDPAKEKEAAIKAAAHNNTPFVMHLDSLGRDILGIEHNIVNGADEFYSTFTKLDIEGNIQQIEDARNNIVMQYKYDMLGHGLYQKSMDAGERWSLNNVLGKPVKTWDNRDHIFYFTYDALHRPRESRVTGGDGLTSLNHIFSKAIYGEGAANDKLNNLRGKIMVLYDTAGKVETTQYDAKGNLLITTRRFAANYKDTVDWATNPDAKLENDVYTSSAEYDAIKRVIRQEFPDGSIMEPGYNEMSLLETLQVTQNANTEIFVKEIQYNEKGQRTKIIYGNDVTTKYNYDKRSFRLLRLENKRLNNDSLQDYYYTYDPNGNITHIQDKNIPAVFFNNQKIDGVSTYTYDALNRLTQANGREHAASLSFGPDDNWNDLPFLKQYNLGDPMVWRNYTQHYQYDSTGNITQINHIAAGGNWLRDYTIAGNSNRMLSTTVGAETYNYSYHPQHGFIEALPHLQVMNWNFKDQLQAVAKQAVNAGTPETTYYVYDGSGARVRKVTERQAGNGVTPTKKSQRLYLGAVELYHEYDNNNSPVLEYNTFHVLDDTRRIAMIDTTTQNNITERLVRYQFPNYLNSACLEADAAGNIISYEEFHPFGTTAYQASDKNIKAAYKRYRYLGMERDEESGLQYHTARYYLPWLGRWLSVDPIGIGDGLNVYRYSRNNPVKFSDTNGNNCGAQPEVETQRKKEKKKGDKEGEENAAKAALTKGQEESGKSSGDGEAAQQPAGMGSSIGEKILEGIKGFGKWIGEAIGKVWDWIKGAASTVWNWIKNAATSAWNWLKNAASSAWNWIKGAASTAWNWIKDTAQSAWNWIKNAAKSAWEWTKQKAAEFWNWFAGDDGFLEDFFEVVGHLTWGLLGTLAGLLFSLVNFTIGNIIVAIHNSKASNAMDQWEYASLTIGGPANENDIIGNYGGLLNLGGAGAAVTLGPFVFFQGSPSSLTSLANSNGQANPSSIQDYYKNEHSSSIYLSQQHLRTADHEEGHEDQNLLYGPFTLLFGLIFSLIPNAAGKPQSSGWYWYDRQANRWSSGSNSPFNPNPNVHHH